MPPVTEPPVLYGVPPSVPGIPPLTEPPMPVFGVDGVDWRVDGGRPGSDGRSPLPDVPLPGRRPEVPPPGKLPDVPVPSVDVCARTGPAARAPPSAATRR